MPATLKRLLAALVTLAVLCGQGLTLLHYVVVPHHLCARHGALEHGVSEHGVAADKAGAATRQTVSSDEVDHEHERCSLPARLEHKGLGVAPPDLVHAQITVHDANVRTTAAAVSRSALLLMAPKQSPPALVQT
jgi:hypothetical protein